MLVSARDIMQIKQTSREKLHLRDYCAVYLWLLCEIAYISIAFVKGVANLTLGRVRMLLFLFVADNMLWEELASASSIEM